MKKEIRKNYGIRCFLQKKHYLCTRIKKKYFKFDSLAQQVEHIPFKDGVLGSSPRRITGVQMNKKAKAFHSWTDPQWKAFFRVFLFLS